MASEPTAHRTSVYNPNDPQSTLLSINMSGVTKLSTVNYLMWNRQVRALLEGHELQIFIDKPAPAATIITNGDSAPDPLYAPWRRQDRLLYSALLGSISLLVQSVVSSATTSKEIWDILAQTFGNPTRGHIRQIKHQILTCVKGTKTISEYLRLIKSKTDDLALLGKAMDQEDITEQILAGLTDEYKPEIDAINGRDTPISFTELHERLLNREAMILCTDSTSALPIVANATNTTSRHNNQRPHNQGTSHYNQHKGPNRFNKPYLGRCQACGIQGHSAKYCPEFRIVKGNNNTQWSAPRPALLPWQQPTPHQAYPPRANAAMLSDSSTWLVDSGASHHMTSDLANLSLHNPYHGNDDVLLGDGSGLQISHTGEGFTNRGSSSRRQA